MAAIPDRERRWYFTRDVLLNSPSRKCQIEPERELSYRQQAATLIQEMGQRLQVNQLCINTAIVYMHRFYVFHSFSKFPINSIEAAALFLAAKVEEQPRKLEYVIKVHHACLHRGGPPLDTKSDAYLQQAQELVINESILLQTIGFVVAVDHPHTHVVKCTQMIRGRFKNAYGAPSKDLAQTSYFMATNSLHLTTFCLQYKPTVVACVCIYLVAKWSQWEIMKSSDGKDWWEYVDSTVTKDLLDDLTSEFLRIFEACPSRLKRRILNEKIASQSRKPRPKDGSSESQQASTSKAMPSSSGSVSSIDSGLPGSGNSESSLNTQELTSGGLMDMDTSNTEFDSKLSLQEVNMGLPTIEASMFSMDAEYMSGSSFNPNLEYKQNFPGSQSDSEAGRSSDGQGHPVKRSLKEYREQKEREQKEREQKEREQKEREQKARERSKAAQLSHETSQQRSAPRPSTQTSQHLSSHKGNVNSPHMDQRHKDRQLAQKQPGSHGQAKNSGRPNDVRLNKDQRPHPQSRLHDPNSQPTHGATASESRHPKSLDQHHKRDSERRLHVPPGKEAKKNGLESKQHGANSRLPETLALVSKESTPLKQSAPQRPHHTETAKLPSEKVLPTESPGKSHPATVRPTKPEASISLRPDKPEKHRTLTPESHKSQKSLAQKTHRSETSQIPSAEKQRTQPSVPPQVPPDVRRVDTERAELTKPINQELPQPQKLERVSVQQPDGVKTHRTPPKKHLSKVQKSEDVYPRKPEVSKVLKSASGSTSRTGSQSEKTAETPKTKNNEAQGSLKLEAPKVLEPELPKVPKVEASKLSKPETTKGPKPVAQKAPKPETPKVHKHETSKVSKPDTPQISKPEASEVLKPEAPKVAKLEAPKVKPETPKVPKPEAPKGPKPDASKVLKLEIHKMLKSESPKLSKPEAPKLSKPETPKAPKPEVPKVSKPEASRAPKPETSKVSKPDAQKSQKTEVPKMARAETPNPQKREVPSTQNDDTFKSKDTETLQAQRLNVPPLASVMMVEQQGSETQELQTGSEKSEAVQAQKATQSQPQRTETSKKQRKSEPRPATPKSQTLQKKVEKVDKLLLKKPANASQKPPALAAPEDVVMKSGEPDVTPSLKPTGKKKSLTPPASKAEGPVPTKPGTLSSQITDASKSKHSGGTNVQNPKKATVLKPVTMTTVKVETPSKPLGAKSQKPDASKLQKSPATATTTEPKKPKTPEAPKANKSDAEETSGNVVWEPAKPLEVLKPATSDPGTDSDSVDADLDQLINKHMAEQSPLQGLVSPTVLDLKTTPDTPQPDVPKCKVQKRERDESELPKSYREKTPHHHHHKKKRSEEHRSKRSPHRHRRSGEHRTAPPPDSNDVSSAAEVGEDAQPHTSILTTSGGIKLKIKCLSNSMNSSNSRQESPEVGRQTSSPGLVMKLSLPKKQTAQVNSDHYPEDESGSERSSVSQQQRHQRSHRRHRHKHHKHKSGSHHRREEGRESHRKKRSHSRSDSLSSGRDISPGVSSPAKRRARSREGRLHPKSLLPNDQSLLNLPMPPDPAMSSGFMGYDIHGSGSTGQFSYTSEFSHHAPLTTVTALPSSDGFGYYPYNQSLDGHLPPPPPPPREGGPPPPPPRPR